MARSVQGLALSCPDTEPDVRRSRHGAAWFLARLLRWLTDAGGYRGRLHGSACSRANPSFSGNEARNDGRLLCSRVTASGRRRSASLSSQRTRANEQRPQNSRVVCCDW